MYRIRAYSTRFKQNKTLYPFRQQKLQKFSNKIDSFHESVGLVLTIGQCFAQIPIVGVLDTNYRNARFEISSYRTICAIMFILIGITEGCLSFKRTQQLNFSLSSLQSLLFIIVCLSGSFQLFALARKWRTLIRFWQAREDCFLRAPYKIKGMRMKTKINVISVTFLIFALIEHVLYIASAVGYDYKQFTLCKIKKINFVEFFFLKERPHIFLVIPFKYLYILPTLWQLLAMTFCWNYVDLMIIVFSIGIATRFNQINYRLELAVKTNINNSFWLDLRKHYVHIVDILQNADEQISVLVLISCSSNLYYICLQLFHSFTPIPQFLSNVYFWYSLTFLIGRTLCVLLFAASVNDAAKKSIGLLRDIPSNLWTIETKRFMDLVTSECHALSGKKFFYLTKNMILAMAGTVVTYELVLLDEVEQEAEHKSLCNITRFNFSAGN